MIVHIIPDKPDRLAQAATRVDQEDAQPVAVLASGLHGQEQALFFFVVQKADSSGTLFLSAEFRKVVDIAHFIRLAQQFAKRRHLSIDGCVAVTAFAQFADQAVDGILVKNAEALSKQYLV